MTIWRNIILIEKNVSTINSKLDKRILPNFGNVLDAYGIDKNIVFEHMHELNALLPDNIHTFCSVNTDATAKQLVNVLPCRYGVLEIIRGYNISFGHFVLWAADQEIYVYFARYTEQDKWRKITQEFVN